MVDCLQRLNDQKETRQIKQGSYEQSRKFGVWGAVISRSLVHALVSFLPPRTAESFIKLVWERPANEDVCCVNNLRPPDYQFNVYICTPSLVETGLSSKKVSYKDYILLIILTSLISRKKNVHCTIDCHVNNSDYKCDPSVSY